MSIIEDEVKLHASARHTFMILPIKTERVIGFVIKGLTILIHYMGGYQVIASRVSFQKLVNDPIVLDMIRCEGFLSRVRTRGLIIQVIWVVLLLRVEVTQEKIVTISLRPVHVVIPVVAADYIRHSSSRPVGRGRDYG